MNVELRMWNFELVARRAMKNYSIKNYLASYSIGEGWERLFYSIFQSHALRLKPFLEKNLGALHRKP